ncbi:hypothetical protein [Streptomyces mirabilis]|uniref:hypothetical protein n=1 Tax=Streptomyces mirabilis TaxID=68239 RepID=UPI0031BB3925
MDTQRVCHYVYFTIPDATESEEDELVMLVEAWSDDGMALVLDEEAGQLVPARERSGFLRVERHDVPQARGILPGGKWRLRKKNDVSNIGHDVLVFLVYDTYVRPVTGLPAPNKSRISSATHHLFRSDD